MLFIFFTKVPSIMFLKIQICVEIRSLVINSFNLCIPLLFLLFWFNHNHFSNFSFIPRHIYITPRYKDRQLYSEFQHRLCVHSLNRSVSRNRRTRKRRKQLKSHRDELFTLPFRKRKSSGSTKRATRHSELF